MSIARSAGNLSRRGASKLHRETDWPAFCACGGGGGDDAVRGDDLALGAKLSGAGYGDVADKKRAVVSCDIGAWDGGFSGDSALAAGGADAL